MFFCLFFDIIPLVFCLEVILTPLTPKGYIQRLIDDQIRHRMKIYGAVCIEGPKWCGKSWTAANHANSVISLGDPSGNFRNKQLAELDPSLILDGKTPHVIDEWQEAPSVWDAVKFRVDQKSAKGQYILTGSSSPRWKGILHSGSGRIANIRMRTMSLYELGKSSGSVSLQSLFQKISLSQATGNVELNSLIDCILCGGWPGTIGLPSEDAQQICRDYLMNLPSDMEKLDGKRRNKRKINALIRSLGRNEGTMASKAVLMKDTIDFDDEKNVSLSETAVTEYLDCFEKLFLIEPQPSFGTNLRSSVKALKHPKHRYSDTSLAAAAIGASEHLLLHDLNTLGFLFESLCIHDLRIYADVINGTVYHYHDERGNEVDAIIQLPDGRWGMFEIKLGFNQIDTAAESLLKLRDTFRTESNCEPEFSCVICGMTSAAFTRKDGVYVLPITALKP